MIALCEGVWQTNEVERTDKMPRLMERDDVMRMAVNLGRAEEVWSEEYDTESGSIGLQLPEGGSYQVVVLRIQPKAPSVPRKGGVRIGSMKGKWRVPTEEEDRAMDEEIVAAMNLDKGFA